MGTSHELACTCGAYFDFSQNGIVHRPGCLVYEMDRQEAERRAATRLPVEPGTYIPLPRSSVRPPNEPTLTAINPAKTGSPTGVVQLHKDKPATEIPETLRRLADKIERGEGLEIVTTALLVLGHTSEKPSKTEPNITQFHAEHELFALGPRVDLFTVRGLLGHALVRLGIENDG